MRKMGVLKSCLPPNTSLTRSWKICYDEVLTKGDFPTARRLNLKKGTLWIQDPRTLHRGTPNRADHVRPELVICYSLPWFAMRKPIEMTQTEYDKLSERGREMLSRCEVIG